MKRDFELVRKILIEYEGRDAQARKTIAPSGYSSDEIYHHIVILMEAGYIGSDEMYDQNGVFLSSRSSQLTWEGHDFLDSIRKDSHWKKIKQKVKDEGFNLTFDTIKAAASALIKLAFLT